MVRCRGGVVTRDMLPFGDLGDDATTLPTSWLEAHREFRRQLVRDALERHGGNRSAAARALGISRQALLYHVRRLGIGGHHRDRDRQKGAGPEARRRKEEV